MTIGMIMLLALGILILFGALQRTLDRMALTDRQALMIVASIFIGGWLPDIPLGLVQLNIGGALIPIIVCVYLFLNAGAMKERVRALVACVLTAAAIYALGMFLPADPVAMPWLDPILLYGAAGGLIAWILGRSRRSAFIAGVLGILIADIVSAFSLWLRGINQTLYLGGAGALDAVVISGVVAVLLCELAGEIMERIRSGKADEGAVEGGARA